MARMYENGSQIGASAIVNSTFARGVFDANSAAHHKQNVQWPNYVAPFFPTYRDTISANAVTTWTPFGQRSSTSNVNVSSRVTEFLFTPPQINNYRFYLGYKMKNTTADGPSNVQTYYHDMTFTGFQVVRGSTILFTYVNTNFDQWSTTTTNISSSSFTNTPAFFSYSQIINGGTARRYNLDTSGTGSAHTGILNGINFTNAFPIATSGTSNSIGPTTGASYAYVETSGVSNNEMFWMRSPFLFLNTITTYSLRVAHYLNTSSTYSTDAQAFSDVCGIFAEPL